MGRVRLLSPRQRELHESRDLSPAVREVARRRSAPRGYAEPSPPEVLRKRELARRLSLNPWTLDRWRKSDSSFPQPIWLSATTPVWLVAEVDAWLGSRPRGGIAPSWPSTSPQRLRRSVKQRSAD